MQRILPAELKQTTGVCSDRAWERIPGLLRDCMTHHGKLMLLAFELSPKTEPIILILVSIFCLGSAFRFGLLLISLILGIRALLVLFGEEELLPYHGEDTIFRVILG